VSGHYLIGGDDWKTGGHCLRENHAPPIPARRKDKDMLVRECFVSCLERDVTFEDDFTRWKRPGRLPLQLLAQGTIAKERELPVQTLQGLAGFQENVYALAMNHLAGGYEANRITWSGSLDARQKEEVREVHVVGHGSARTGVSNELLID